MDASAQTVTAFVVAGAVIWVLVGLLVYAWYAVALSGVFARLGVPSRRAWVPFVNEAEILRIGGYSPWLVLLFLVPVANLYALLLRVRSVHRIGARFGRGAGTTVLGMLLPPVWATVLVVASDDTAEEPARRMASVSSGGPVTGPLAALQRAFQEDEVPAPFGAAAPPSWRPTPALPVPTRPAPLDAVRPVSAPPPVPSVPAAAAAARVIPPMPAPRPVEDPFAPTPASAARNALVPPNGDAPILVHRPGSASVPASEDLAVGLIAADARDLDDDTETAVVDRRPRVRWELVVDDGRSYELSAPVVVLGRRPAGAEPGVQYLAVADSSRSVSKQHARLTLAGEQWEITDLGSTNGVFIVEGGGTRREVAAHESVAVADRVALGTVGFRLRRREVA